MLHRISVTTRFAGRLRLHLFSLATLLAFGAAQLSADHHAAETAQEHPVACSFCLQHESTEPLPPGAVFTPSGVATTAVPPTRAGVNRQVHILSPPARAPPAS